MVAEGPRISLLFYIVYKRNRCCSSQYTRGRVKQQMERTTGRNEKAKTEGNTLDCQKIMNAFSRLQFTEMPSFDFPICDLKWKLTASLPPCAFSQTYADFHIVWFPKWRYIFVWLSFYSTPTN